MAAEALPKITKYVRLGNSGLKISPLVLGCMSYGNKLWGEWILEEEDALPHFKAAYDMGLNTWDTANTYSNGDSEVIVGKAIKKYNIPREELVIMTKVRMICVPKDKTKHVMTCTNPDAEGLVNQYGLSRKHIFDSIRASLDRMQLEYVDLLQCHRFDYDTPIEETMDALHDSVKLGLVRYIGMSACYAWQFHAMQNYAKSKGQTQFISMQNQHNAIYREEEREMIPLCRMLSVGVIPYSPLAKGFLTRPQGDTSTARATTDKMYNSLKKDFAERPMHADINQAIQTIAEKRGLKMSQVALAWSLAQPGITAPIIGSTKIESIVELVKALDVKLTNEELKTISDPYQSRLLSWDSPDLVYF